MLDQQELHVRAAYFAAVRSFFNTKEFLEVDTPLRQPVIIPESTIVPLVAGEHFLQTSPELCMKRLLSSGCERIFQICPCFRKEESGRHHLEEFTMLEWYRTNASYLQLMEDCEDLLVFLIAELHSLFKVEMFPAGSLIKKLDVFKAGLPWARITVQEAFERYSPESLDQVLEKGSFDEILVEHIEPQLGLDCPVFLYDYPESMASLARKKKDQPHLAERFELYSLGLELANGFSELTDSSEQRVRFEQELFEITRGGRTTGGMPERFLTELEGLGEAAGIALGMDRLLMLILGKERVEDAVTFGPEDF